MLTVSLLFRHFQVAWWLLSIHWFCLVLQVLSSHSSQVQCLAFSRDDRFLISVGDYTERSIVVWSTRDWEILTSSTSRSPVHELQWDPYTGNEFVSVGQDGSVSFWLLDEATGNIVMNVRFFCFSTSINARRFEFKMSLITSSTVSVLFCWRRSPPPVRLSVISRTCVLCFRHFVFLFVATSKAPCS